MTGVGVALIVWGVGSAVLAGRVLQCNFGRWPGGVKLAGFVFAWPVWVPMVLVRAAVSFAKDVCRVIR
jgi:hypothetical protein